MLYGELPRVHVTLKSITTFLEIHSNNRLVSYVFYSFDITV